MTSLNNTFKDPDGHIYNEYISDLSAVVIVPRETVDEVKRVLMEIFEDTDAYADGAPDASEHDKMCNQISSLAHHALAKLNAATKGGKDK